MAFRIICALHDNGSGNFLADGQQRVNYQNLRQALSNGIANEPADQKVIYEQRCEDFRSLNGFLWQSPLIIMTLTGGLWFAVASFEISDRARSMLLIFAGISNLLMIIALIRLRYVMQWVLADIRSYDGKGKIGGNFIIVGTFCALLMFAAVGSFVAGCGPAAYFSKNAAAKAAP